MMDQFNHLLGNRNDSDNDYEEFDEKKERKVFYDAIGFVEDNSTVNLDEIQKNIRLARSKLT